MDDTIAGDEGEKVWTTEELDGAAQYMLHAFLSATEDMPIAIPIYSGFCLMKLSLDELQKIAGPRATLEILGPMYRELTLLSERLFDVMTEAENATQAAE